MNELDYSLKNIATSEINGAYQTRAERHDMLQDMAKTLKKNGYKLAHARSLKPKHVHFLVDHWKQNNVSTGAIKNRMSALRYWARAINKLSMMHKTNAEYGIEARKKDTSNRAFSLTADQLNQIPCPRMRLSLRLAEVFGLRTEEALKFNPSYADKGDKILLKKSWTKGGRPREIPIRTEQQRALIDEAHTLVGKQSLIPAEKTYMQHLKAYEYRTKKAGFKNLHGLRHQYAQERYKDLSGMICPKAGGKTKKDMTPEELARDKKARLIISQELGHNRIEITVKYLG